MPIFSMQKENEQTERHDEANAHSSQIFCSSYKEMNIKGKQMGEQVVSCGNPSDNYLIGAWFKCVLEYRLTWWEL